MPNLTEVEILQIVQVLKSSFPSYKVTKPDLESLQLIFAGQDPSRILNAALLYCRTDETGKPPRPAQLIKLAKELSGSKKPKQDDPEIIFNHGPHYTYARMGPISRKAWDSWGGGSIEAAQKRWDAMPDRKSLWHDEPLRVEKIWNDAKWSFVNIVNALKGQTEKYDARLTHEEANAALANLNSIGIEAKNLLKGIE